ncbi:DEAD/DEAH box helicase [Shewanella intestini]|uniref:DEAD/DEAH box helicase n=1 Tax=Shewanella intestini TaxID=2017544 RepID=A0ABS5I093_9GAMM|nr:MULTISPECIES: DEAD/DEAH box helicase [Shewanella]MBR9727440.1 DEAD/DEAH box helicase [Shewanella intestini]MRG35510.1 DEAD/DEAH box helicase [Shewanella sp. XMDDZSB0408]
MATALTTTFADFALHASILSRLTELGYQTPTEVQSTTIPVILTGVDVMAGANTGSGKTAAFALPILQQLSMQLDNPATTKKTSNTIHHLVLVPTRELAKQVADNFISYASHFNGKVKVVCALGGVSINTQMLALRGGADVLVATPGRLLDLVSSNAIKLNQVKQFVLDEADRLLSLGFADELNNILALLPKQKQTLLFSATFPEEVHSLANALLVNPKQFALQSAEQSTLVQRVMTVNREKKTALLAHLIKENNWRQVLIFASAKKSCNHLAQKLEKRGITAQVFHGDQAQGARTRVLNGFKQGDIDVLVATDIAARGIDIDKLPVVINFDLPRSPADYMHRIGRSGRAGEVGLALTLLSHDDYHHFKVIEKKNKIRLEREQVAGFEADDEMPETLLDIPKPMAKPEGMGKKKRTNIPQANKNIWSQTKSNPE